VMAAATAAPTAILVLKKTLWCETVVTLFDIS